MTSAESSISRQKQRHRSHKKKELDKVRYRNSRLLEQNVRLAAKYAKYKQRYYRSRLRESEQKNSPRSNVMRNLCRENVKFIPPSVKKKLIFGESLKRDVESAVTSAKHITSTTVGSKEALRSVLKFSSLKKYRFLSSSKPCYNFAVRAPRRSIQFGKAKVRSEYVQNLVVEFFLRDDVSIMAPGKRDCIRGQQKRYLTNSLKSLHRKFCASDAPVMVSYSLFCQSKPAFVVSKKFGDRDTCLCYKHENMHFMIEHICKNVNVLESPYPDTVMKELMCTEPSDACYYRKCRLCKDKEITFNLGELNGMEDTSYYSWDRKQEEYSDGKTTKIVKRWVKGKKNCKVHELVDLVISKELPKYMCHVGNVRVQYREIRKLREELRSDEALVHIDFSENYNCKYASEIQAVHFGASRQEICLHTGMLYVGQDYMESFSTISACLRHDPIAIITHIRPILQRI